MVTTGYLKKASPQPADQNICEEHWVFKEGVTTPSRPEQLWGPLGIQRRRHHTKQATTTVKTTWHLKKASPHQAGQNNCEDHRVFKEGVTTPSRPEQLWGPLAGEIA